MAWEHIRGISVHFEKVHTYGLPLNGLGRREHDFDIGS